MNDEIKQRIDTLTAAGLGKETIFAQLLAHGYKVEEINAAFAGPTVPLPSQPVPPVVPEDTQNRTVSLLVSIGALLIGVGIFSFVAANWQYMDSVLKMGILILALLITNGLGWYLKEQKGYDKAGVALYFLGNLIYGAAIFLTAQIFNIQENWPDGFMLWMIGTAAMAFVLQQYSLYYLAAVVGFIAIFGQPFSIFNDPLTINNFALTPSFLLLLSTGVAAFIGISVRNRVPADQKGFF